MNALKLYSNKDIIEIDIVSKYLLAKKYIIDVGYADEIDWQDNVQTRHLTEQVFIREAAWVVLSSGMRETVIKNLFAKISTTFYNWKSAHNIVRDKDSIRPHALMIFNNTRKIDAILQISDLVAQTGIDNISYDLAQYGHEYLQIFPFMGPATSAHLAKNLGLDIAKPDRHLVRISHRMGYSSPNDLCKVIATYVGDPISVVDIVLWRYATLSSSHNNIFSDMYNSNNANINSPNTFQNCFVFDM